MSAFLIQSLNGLASAASLFLVAAGLTLIFGVTRIVNFAHGSFYMLGVYVALTVAEAVGGAAGFWAGLAAAAAAVALLGVAIETTILRRIYAAPELLQLTATFALVLILKDVALAIWGPEDRLGPRAPGMLGGALTLGERAFPIWDLCLIAIGVAMLALLTFLTRRTRFGLLVRAATEDREMASALGVNERALFTAVFALGSALAGLGGALQLPREPASLALDLALIADVFVVVVIGGLGSIPGAFVAAVIVSLVKAWCIALGQVNLGTLTLDFTKLTLVAEFLVMAVVLLLRPHGLFGRPLRHGPADREALYEPRPAPSARTLAWVAGGCLAAAVVPVVLDDYSAVLATDIAVFALFAASLAFIIGTGGMGSFGHAAYFGLGAYGAALAAQAGWPFAMALGAGLALAALAAALFGALSVRLSGTYMAMLTLAFAQIVWSVVFQWDAVTGGSNGLTGVWPPEALAERNRFYLFALALCGGGVLLIAWLALTPFGHALRAVRDARVKAEAIGLAATRLQWTAFTVGGALAGLAGAVYAFSKGSISPDVLSIPRSVDALVMVLLGGLNTLFGPVLGAALFTWLADVLARATEYWRAALGAAILAVVLVAPRGVLGTLAAWQQRQGARRQP
ncbi:MAG: ABC transporter permease [Casimicrobiaceae bacterium]|nr:ABC transporter permease [Casimicrobiaceae bacterium]